jgi:hypothetical protein
LSGLSRAVLLGTLSDCSMKEGRAWGGGGFEVGGSKFSF